MVRVAEKLWIAYIEREKMSSGKSLMLLAGMCPGILWKDSRERRVLAAGGCGLAIPQDAAPALTRLKSMPVVCACPDDPTKREERERR
jgi:hypothetical protein